MAKKQSKYDYEANDKLSSFVRIHYKNHLSNGALQLYLLGMPYLEQRKSGFCQKVIANYDEIAQAACKDYSGLKKLLLELKNTLCDIQIGNPIKRDKRATEFRRYTQDELQEKRRKLLITEEPAHAKELSEILSKRSFVYGTDLECSPFWNIAKTGRVLSSKPNVQGDSKDKRVKNLLIGLNDGQVLFDLDIKQAEPSIIQQVIKYNFGSDPYNLLADIKNITRDEAKREINRLAYSSANSAKIVQYWPPAAKEKFMPYAVALDSYKAKLWESGKPINKQRRFADTLNGTRIVADRGRRNHRGKILCWHIQGTVADIINSACLEIIERENFEGWKLLFPVHDSIYVVGNNQHIGDLKKIIVKKAECVNLNLTVNCDVVGKNQ